MTVTNYLWNEDSYLEEYDEVGTATVTYTNEPIVFGNLLSQRKDSSTSFYHYDVLGSTSELSDSTETVTDSYLYGAWGNLVASTGTTANPFRWIGKVGYYFDEDTTDYYVRARYYQPVNVRWRSKDPIKFHEKISEYAYALNSPIVRIDYTGKKSKPIPGRKLLPCEKPKSPASKLGSNNGCFKEYFEPTSYWSVEEVAATTIGGPMLDAGGVSGNVVLAITCVYRREHTACYKCCPACSKTGWQILGPIYEYAKQTHDTEIHSFFGTKVELNFTPDWYGAAKNIIGLIWGEDIAGYLPDFSLTDLQLVQRTYLKQRVFVNLT